MPTFTVTTFGCQMNQHDSERIAETLVRAGYAQVDERAQADVLVLNTCSVREKAVQKLRSEVGRIGQLKRDNPELIVAVAGCVAQQEGERLIRQLPQIDLLIGPDNIAELPAMLTSVEHGAPPQVRTQFDLERPQFLKALPAPGRRVPSAFVTTMKGCDERCTFCIVPYTRGPERYRASADVIGEIRAWVEAGTREVTLLGQTVDSYRDPSGALPTAAGVGENARRFPTAKQRREADGSLPSTPDETEFPALLRAIAAEVPGLRRLRYTSPHPRHLTPALVLAHRELQLLAKHVHMPVQSGSDRVLKRMGRRYNLAEYLERTELLKQSVAGLSLSTDVIVGFPGETADDFEATLELIRKLGFVGVFAFKYSERPFTPALKLADDVSEEEKSRRLTALFEVSEQLRREHLAGLVGTEQEVLVEDSNAPGAYSGRTVRNEIVHFGSQQDVVGQMVQLRVTGAFKHSLRGELIDSALRASLPERASKRALTLL